MDGVFLIKPVEHHLPILHRIVLYLYIIIIIHYYILLYYIILLLLYIIICISVIHFYRSMELSQIVVH